MDIVLYVLILMTIELGEPTYAEAYVFPTEEICEAAAEHFEEAFVDQANLYHSGCLEVELEVEPHGVET